MIYIYSLASSNDPTNIRYIGKARDIKDRIRRHIGKHYLNNEINYKNNWVKSELRNGNKIIIEVLEEVDDEKWEESEILWIEKYKNMGYKLTNTTIGGDGLKLTSDIIEKRSKTRKKNNLESKKIDIERFNVKEIDNKFTGERVCPNCHRIVIHKSNNINKIINLLKKSIDRNCINCSSKIKTPFRNHTWNNKGKKYPNSINPKIMKEKYGKKIQQYDLENNLIDEFNSIRDASKKTNIDRKSISQCIRGVCGRKTAGGYIFKENINKK